MLAASPPMRPTVPFILTGFACGAIALQGCATLPAWASGMLGAGAGIVSGAIWYRGWPHSGVRALFVLMLAAAGAALAGFGYAAWRAEYRLADALPIAWEGVDLRLTGVVDDLPQAMDDGARFAFAVETVETPSAVVPSRVGLAWFASRSREGREAKTADVPEVHAGERWTLTVRLKRPHGSVNPAGFDLEAWLLEHNLRATGYVRPDAHNVRTERFVGRPGDYVERAREQVRARILAALPGAAYAGVMVALAIGDQRAITESQWLVFNRTGIAHLVSISGLHVTVFAALAGGVAFAIARRWRWLRSRVPAPRVAAAVGVAFAFGYVQLAGAEVPAVRTLLMLAVGAAGLWLGRPGTAPLVWLWSLVTVLLWDPWASLAPGFWLSFGAVGLLLYAGSGRLAPPVFDSRRARVANGLREGARTQWVVTLGLVPGTLALFQQISLVSALANAVAIPVVTLAIVPLTLAGIIIPVELLWRVAHALLAVLMQWLEALAALPSAVWSQHAPPTWTVVVAMVGVLLLLSPRGVPGRALGVVWLLPIFLARPAPPPQGAFRLTALDVGQGLAVVVETSTHALVYDTGPRYGANADAGGRIVAPYLRAAGIAKLDALIVSHQDLDHSGGALSLLQTVPVETLWSSLPVEGAIVARASTHGTAWRCVEGQAWTWDDVRFTVLFPPPAQYANAGVKPNDLSCVLRIESAHGAALLTGDIEARSESALLARAAPLRADVLVVPHHGSRTSSTPAFVAAVHPRIAIFTAGYRNRFGHPRPDIVLRYADIAAAALRSDVHGAISITIGIEGVGAPVAAREAHQRYWYDGAPADADGRD